MGRGGKRTTHHTPLHPLEIHKTITPLGIPPRNRAPNRIIRLSPTRTQNPALGLSLPLHMGTMDRIVGAVPAGAEMLDFALQFGGAVDGIVGGVPAGAEARDGAVGEERSGEFDRCGCG